MQILSTKRRIHLVENPMTLDQVTAIVPAAFADYADERVSKKYVFISTKQVYEDMSALGFKAIWAHQRRGKDSPFKKHWIKFFHPDHVIRREDGAITEIFEVTISNSHDGRAGFNLAAGIYRLVCDNGMMALDSDQGKIRLRHMGYSSEELSKMIHDLSAHFPVMLQKIDTMKKRIMTDQEMVTFATNAMKTRWDKEVKIDVNKLIKSIRPEDDQNTLWNVYNRVQEKLVKGQFTTFSGRIVRGLTNVDALVKLNEKLYTQALELCQ